MTENLGESYTYLQFLENDPCDSELRMNGKYRSMNRVLTIYSSERKIGKTMLGINLGVSLINETQKSVLVLDISADEEGIPAWSMLKLPFSDSLQTKELTIPHIQEHIQNHSSQLSLLTLDSARLHEENSPTQFIS